MPDPVLYLLTVVASAGLSALVALGFAKWRWPADVACGLALAAGIACGAYLLKLPVRWPPATGLGRLFAILLPAVIGIEMLWALPAIPKRLVWCGRLALALAAGRILLHGSVYLSGDRPEWSTWQTILVLVGSGGVLAGAWVPLLALGRRSETVSIPLALAEAILCGGLTVMLKGYVGGGEASLPIVGALAGYGLAVGLHGSQGHVHEEVIAIGVVGLFGLLFVGRFFGQLSTPRALTLFLAPLLCWATEISYLRRQPPWRVACIRLAFVAIPLIVVVLLAKRDFDRTLRPVLSAATGPQWPVESLQGTDAVPFRRIPMDDPFVRTERHGVRSLQRFLIPPARHSCRARPADLFAESLLRVILCVQKSRRPLGRGDG